ncbi:MAG: isoprenylcysteine carboxylmethyltransferase family protein [Elusimicrobia bacterium]|nr:isoprenylcysteine carboxylmethyltransferase family protein [Elusimicrobiota bacterium]
MSGSAPDNPGVRVPSPLVFAAAFALGLLLQKFCPAPELSPSLRRALALLCFAVSAALGGWGFAWFLRLRTTVLPSRPSAALITSGPYRFSRNPLYAATALLYAGLALWSGALWALLLLPAAMVVLQRHVIAKEEAYLERRFGADYLDYKDRVRRWL